MRKILDFINSNYVITDTFSISILDVLILTITLTTASVVIRLFKKIVNRKLLPENELKVRSIFSYLTWIIYVVIFLVTISKMGVNLTALFAASAALLIGVGLALQTLFQDIISGVFIMIDKSVHAGDIIELEGKVGRVEEIKLRTTRAVTLNNKVLIIPNHLYLTNSLYNWTQNGTTTRESVKVGVAYGSDVQLVKELLIKAAKSHPSVLVSPPVSVLFEDFGDSSLNFKVVFTLADSFKAQYPQSDIRFEIDRLFREHNISIPFPQRDIHVYSNTQGLVK
ncbi:mechanosensitive ion channel protein MscS [Polaribacter sejongensis]|uniref:Mechanosensitive ion channel protein MscS n=1 Tax=Polaribacter sejongensis TaxID=985043 RepID=A0ABM6PZJ0_9FLAO|nr:MULTISPECIES: mechanosensitive ion channel domain-containing protein [Polaribacter]AUC22282.1 mechanosensitive ion channel protein MscS [Polaribacter sejongensis]